MTDLCQAKTQGGPPFYRGSQCSKKAVQDGFCKIHHPDAKEARREARAKAGDERLERWRREQEFKTKRPADYRAALTLIAAGVGDPREVAREALEKWGEDQQWQEPR